MRKMISFAALAVAAVLAGPALADTIILNQVPIDGKVGLGGKFHRIVVDGVSCLVKNSASVPGATQGCNYTLTLSGIGADGKVGTWTVVPQQQNGCSTTCEKMDPPPK